MDAWRYYLTTQGPLGATDANFSSSKFHEIYTTHLVNTVGNSVSRVLAMIGKYFDRIVPTESPGGTPLAIGEHDWPSRCAAAVEQWQASMERFAIDAAIEAPMSLIRDVDAFINETEPYKIAKEEDRRDELAAILYQCAETLRIALVLLSPVAPRGASALWEAMGLEDTGTLSDRIAWGGLSPGVAVTKVALYPRIELEPA
jgi:methionyl-tRNA synthetase